MLGTESAPRAEQNQWRAYMDDSRDRAVVVGGGIVGMATAVSLAERGHPAMVLEAEERSQPTRPATTAA